MKRKVILENEEKWIYCPDCRRLSIHQRMTGEAKGWLCTGCTPPLEDYS
jgi:ribosomal protein L37AE/L43A